MLCIKDSLDRIIDIYRYTAHGVPACCVGVRQSTTNTINISHVPGGSPCNSY